MRSVTAVWRQERIAAKVLPLLGERVGVRGNGPSENSRAYSLEMSRNPPNSYHSTPGTRHSS